MATYEQLLETSKKAGWRIDDIIGGDRTLDFQRPFLPETYARTAPLSFLTEAEKLKLNHIRARCYLALFELLEQTIVPFISEQAAQSGPNDPFRTLALRQFVREENKHRELFRRFLAEFDAGFGPGCALIGPAEAICAMVLAKSPLAVTMAVLGLEWMSQTHFVDSVQGDEALDPQFRSLLEHHWREEAQHAALDGLVMGEMAARLSPEDIDAATEEYFAIQAFFDDGFRAQAGLDLGAFERAIGRPLTEPQRDSFVGAQHRALAWTFIGSAMRNENFLAALEGISARARSRVEAAAGPYCLH